jgi:hypothetical protein
MIMLQFGINMVLSHFPILHSTPSSCSSGSDHRVAVPKNPIILAHGLFGFDELHIAGNFLPGVHYWRGIREALAQKNVEVITATVPPSGTIEMRAARLAETIAAKAEGKSVNIIAYAVLFQLRDREKLTVVHNSHSMVRMSQTELEIQANNCRGR